MSAQGVFIILWLVLAVVNIGSFVMLAKTIYMLKERHPDLYKSIGSPSLLMPSIEFLWSLRSREPELGAVNFKLVKKTLVITSINWACTIMVMMVAFFL